jgi:hypothetical protein
MDRYEKNPLKNPAAQEAKCSPKVQYSKGF